MENGDKPEFLNIFKGLKITGYLRWRNIVHYNSL